MGKAPYQKLNDLTNPFNCNRIFSFFLSLTCQFCPCFLHHFWKLKVMAAYWQQYCLPLPHPRHMIIPWEHQDYKNTHEKKIYVNSYNFIYLKGGGQFLKKLKWCTIGRGGEGGLQDNKVYQLSWQIHNPCE